MAIGNSIDYSIPTTGTKVGDFSRSNSNSFLEAYAAGSGTYPATLTLRPAAPISTAKRFGISTKVRPSDSDDPGAITKGAVTVSINIDATPGSTMTKAEIAEFVRYTLSVMMAPNLIEDLHDGIVV